MGTQKEFVAGGRQGLAYKSIGTGGDTFITDRAYYVKEIRFKHASLALDDETVTLEFEGQSVFSNQAVPFPMLQATVSANMQAAGAQNVVIFRPEVPILWNKTFGIKVTPSVACGVMLIGDPA